MTTLRTITRWLHIDKWLRAHRPHLSGAAAGLAIIIAWIITGSFWRGVGLVIFLTAAWFTVLAARWLVHRIRVTTEAGIPISPIRMVKELIAERAKFTDADNRWALAMRAQKVVYDGHSPHLHRKTTTASGDVRASINLAGIGGNLDRIKGIASDGTLAGIMHCQEVTVRENLAKPGRAQITFHKVPPLSEGIPLAELAVSGPDRVTMGNEEDREAAAIAYGLSVMAVGETGSGKSKLGWNMFADILRDGKPTEMWVIDPKGTELAVFKRMVGQTVGNIRIMDYKRTPDEAVALFGQFVAEMKDRQDRLEQSGIRQLTAPTEDMPARFVWVDEMNELQKAYKTVDSPMVTAISQGRSSLDWVVGMVQVAKVSNLGEVRDQFPINACLRTRTRENTKAALGLEGEDIPPCHRIPRSAVGVGYYVREDGEVRKFRTSHVTDKQLDDLAKGILPKGMITAAKVRYDGPPCFVYLAPEKKTTKIGYVGIAGGNALERHPVARRRAQHRKYDLTWCAEHERVENFWNVHIDDRRMTVHKYPSRSAALVAEERLIKELRPRWNIQHNGANPFANVNLAKRAGIRFRAKDAGQQYLELGRESWALRQVTAGFRKQERVARQVEKSDRFVERVLADSRR